MQYTLRGISQNLDRAARERAKTEGKSLNEVAVEALAQGLGVSGEPIEYRDLQDVVGTWKRDRKLEEALEEQHQIDENLWK